METISLLAATENIKASKEACYQKMLVALSDLEAWEKEELKFGISQMGKISFCYIDNWNGMEVEMQLMIVDEAYAAFSGTKMIRNRANLFYLKQLDAYVAYEQGILHFGLTFLRGKQRDEFIEKYVKPYNEKVKKQKDK
jgi:hypothetical protein